MGNEKLQEAAAARLEQEFSELGQAKATGGREAMLRYMARPVGEMLAKFCWQSEDFASAVLERRATLRACLQDILKDVTSGISDVEAYAAAVRFYMPGAKVRAIFRVDAPREQDDDLDWLPEQDDVPPEGGAILLDLDLGGERDGDPGLQGL